MKKNLPTFLLLLAAFFTLTPAAYATHYMGVDITYTCNPNGNNPCVYRIFHNTYYDCNGSAMGGFVRPLNSTGFIAPTISFIAVPNTCTTPTAVGASWILTSYTEVTPICPGTQTKCTNSAATINGVVEAKYYRDYDFCTSAAACKFNITSSLCCRNDAITTVNSPGSYNIYTGSTLIDKSIIPCNSSPQFTSKPVPYLCLGQNYTFNQGAVDPDGDSLSYAFVPCKSAAATNIPYNSASYTFSQPMTSTPPITLDSITGDITINPTQIEITIMCLEVKEWRNGVNIGTVMRDMQITVLNCGANNLPQTYGINGTNAAPNPVFRDTFCAGVQDCFNVNSYDPDAGQPLTMTWNNAITGASFTTSAGLHPSGTFCWTPQLSDAGLHQFIVTIKDNACPILGINSYAYEIFVIPGTYIGPDQYYCPGGGPIPLFATGGTSFSWTPAAGLSCTNCQNPQASPSTTTTYIVTSNLLNGCKNKDTVVVNIVPDFTLTTSPDVTICKNQFTQLNANGSPGGFAPFTYKWTPSSYLSSDTVSNPTAGPPFTTTYYVKATSNTGCTMRDSVKVTINGVAPIINAFADDPLICPGASTSVGVKFEQPCGIADYACSGAAVQANVGTATSSTTDYSPFYGTILLPPYKRQYIYAANEILNAWPAGNDGGNINSLAFNVSSLPAAPNPYTISVKIGCTGQSEFSASNSPFITGLVEVKANFMINLVLGWNVIPFDFPYHWDSQSNIVVEICTNVGSVYSASVFTTSTAPRYTTLYKNTVDTVGVGCLAPKGVTRANFRPDIQFSMCPAVPTAGYSYSWTPAGSVANPSVPATNVTPPFTTTYTITLTDLTNPACTGMSTVQVAIDSFNYVTGSPDTTVCPGDSVQLNAVVSGPPPTSSIPCALASSPCMTNHTEQVGGANTSGGTTSGISPYYGYWHDNRLLMLFKANEMDTADIPSGTINAIAFEVASKNSTQPYQNFTIKMACTNLTSLSTAVGFNPAMSVVLGPVIVNPIVGWNTHTLTSPYNWDGISNLLVEICFDNTSYTLNDAVKYTSTPYTSVLHAYTDGGTGCSLTAQYISTNRPNTRFTICDAPPVFLAYSWSPPGSVTNPNIANPKAQINSNMGFQVTVLNGKCTIKDSVHISAACTPLAMDLLSFTGEKNISQIDLKWQTGREENNDHFIIEKSEDGTRFRPIGKISSAGTSSVNDYIYPDKYPSPGINYYRLKQVDTEGASQYSAVIEVDFSSAEGITKIYPNPATKELNAELYIPEKGIVEIEMTDMIGRVCLKRSVEMRQEYEKIRLDIHELEAGTYILKLHRDSGVSYMQIVKY